MPNPEWHECYKCKHRWRTGEHGGHDCSGNLVAQLTAARADVERLQAEVTELKANLAESAVAAAHNKQEYSRTWDERTEAMLEAQRLRQAYSKLDAEVASVYHNMVNARSSLMRGSKG